MSDPFKELCLDVWQAMQHRECHEEVTRKGELQPCDKPAVAVRRDAGGEPYPVCVYHCHGGMVPLWQLRRAMQG